MVRGKAALITGGTGGLGKAVVQAFQEAGAVLALSYRDEAKLREMALTGAPPVAIKADVTAWESVRSLVDETVARLGRIDILVNLAGGFAGGVAVADTPETLWDAQLNLNLKSAFLCCKAVLPIMAAAGGGKIVNVSSRAALKGGARVGAYSVAKAGLITLTESIAEEVKNLNINVNVILPSVIDTPANRQSMPKADFSRWVKPEEIASVIVFLCSEEARSINGAAIPVFGRA